MLTIASIDQHLSRQGAFCLIDWLLSQNLLQYPLFESWRYGDREHIDDALELDRPTLRNLINDTETHCKALGLYGEVQDYHHWNSDNPQLLFASRDPDIHRQLTRQWLRPQDRPQLDLFMDNAAVVAENHLRDALGSRRFDDASRHLGELARLNPAHPQLGRFQDLVNYGQHIVANESIAREQLAAELNGLQQEVEPLAREILGQTARDYLAFAWRRLADNMTEMTFEPDNPNLHRSYALAQIPDWPAVRECLNKTEETAQYPQLLERLALAGDALRETEKAFLLWCRLFEQHTEYAESAIDRHPRQPVNELWQAFWELDETIEGNFEPEWFAAFVFTRQPGLCHQLDKSPRLSHPATVAMIRLIKARLEKGNEIAEREALKAVHPNLLRMYMANQAIG